MRVELNDASIHFNDRTVRIGTADAVLVTRAAPIVKIDHDDVSNRPSLEAARIEIENEEGVVARFWVHVSIHNGRPQISVATKIGKERLRQSQKSVVGTFNIV